MIKRQALFDWFVGLEVKQLINFWKKENRTTRSGHTYTLLKLRDLCVGILQNKAEWMEIIKKRKKHVYIRNRNISSQKRLHIVPSCHVLGQNLQ